MKPQIHTDSHRCRTRKIRGHQCESVAFAVGTRVYLAIAGYAMGSKVFLPKGARGVVTAADPTGDMLTIQFDLPTGPVAGLRLPVTHVCKINHDVQPEHVRE